MGSFPRNPRIYFRSSFFKQRRGFRRSEIAVLNLFYLFLTRLPPLAAAEVSLWREKFTRKTQSRLAGGFTCCNAYRSYFSWVTACLLAATWPRRLRQADEAGFCLLTCDFLHSAALPGVRGQTKSPPPYDTLPKGETDTNQTEN